MPSIESNRITLKVIYLFFNNVHKSLLKLLVAATLIIVSFSSGYAQETIRLWEGKAPGSESWDYEETTASFGGRSIIRNVVDPTMTVYLPEASESNGIAVIVCPGGALRVLSMESGAATAKWLNKHGFTAFVLKYRLLKTDGAPQMGGGRAGFSDVKLELKNANANPSPDNEAHTEVIRLSTLDGQQAIRLVRRNAKKWNINPAKIGIMGFSAGGGVAVHTALLDDPEGYPDFVVSLYGPSLVDVHVPDNAPPLFIAVATNHKPVSLGCVALYSVWDAAGKSAELHVYSKGGAFGMDPRGIPSDTWTDRFLDWIKGEGLLD